VTVLRRVRCHDVVGAYESITVVLTDGREISGSRLTLAEALDSPGAIVVHSGCDGASARPTAPER
jgi:hypothetical protein